MSDDTVYDELLEDLTGKPHQEVIPRQSTENGEPNGGDNVDLIVDIFSDILGDDEVARAFVDTSSMIKFSFSTDNKEQQYVISPAVWGVMSLLPEEFGAKHFAILMHLVMLKTALKKHKAEVEMSFDSLLFTKKSAYDKKHRDAYSARRADKKTEKESIAFANEVTASEKEELEVMKMTRTQMLAKIDADISMVRDIISAIRLHVSYITNNMDSVAPTFDREKLVAFFAALSQND